MKLTKKQIEEIIRMKNEGISTQELSKKFNVSKNAILYHFNPKLKEKIIQKGIERYSKLSKEEKRKLSKKHYPYNKEYIKNRYHNDPEFRKRFIDYVKDYKRKNRLKALKIGNCTICFKENDSNFRICLKCREKRRIKHHLTYKKTR